MSTTTDQRIINEFRLHDPQENDSIYDFYCDDPQHFDEHMAAAVRDYCAAQGLDHAEADALYLHTVFEDALYREDSHTFRVHLAAHGITTVEDQPKRLVTFIDWFATLADAQEPDNYE